MRALWIGIAVLVLQASVPGTEQEPRTLVQPEVRIFYAHATKTVKLWWQNVKGQAYYVEISTDGGQTWEPAIEQWPWVSRARTLYVWHDIESDPTRSAIFRVSTILD